VYLDLTDAHLIVSMSGTTRIPYSRIADVERIIPDPADKRREQLAVSWGKLFGGGDFTAHDSRIRVHLREWTWCFTLYFLVPRRSITIYLAQPEEFVEDLRVRLSEAAA